jgi:uncharacterized Rmd1/YagE family protein
MEKQIKLITELLKVSNQPNDNFKKENDKSIWDSSKRKIKIQKDLMNQLKKRAIELDTLIGRVLKFPTADSYAVYVITKVFKNHVKVAWIDYCDGWENDIAYDNKVDIRIAKNMTEQEERIDAVFAKNGLV